MGVTDLGEVRELIYRRAEMKPPARRPPCFDAFWDRVYTVSLPNESP